MIILFQSLKGIYILRTAASLDGRSQRARVVLYPILAVQPVDESL